MLSRLAPLCDCGLLVPSALPCAEAALPGGGNSLVWLIEQYFMAAWWQCGLPDRIGPLADSAALPLMSPGRSSCNQGNSKTRTVLSNYNFRLSGAIGLLWGYHPFTDNNKQQKVCGLSSLSFSSFTGTWFKYHHWKGRTTLVIWPFGQLDRMGGTEACYSSSTTCFGI